MQKNILVGTRGNIWEVRPEGSQTPASLHKTKAAAFASARSVARKKHTTVVLYYSSDGHVVTSPTTK